MQITLQDKIVEVKRELRLRYQNYPAWQIAGRITPERAEKQIRVMEAILADLMREKDKSQPKLI